MLWSLQEPIRRLDGCLQEQHPNAVLHNSISTNNSLSVLRPARLFAVPSPHGIITVLNLSWPSFVLSLTLKPPL